MIKTLRQYQENDSLMIRKALAKYRRVLYQLSTGGGKTQIATDIVERAVNKKIKCVFLTDRVRILNQAYDTFKSHGIKCEKFEANTDYLWITDIYVCMVETFYRRFSKGWFNGINIGLVIVDEAHMKNFAKVLEFFPTQYILGLTATPVSGGEKPLNKIYNNIVIGESKSSLIENGYLVPSIDIGHNQMLDLMKQAGEFTASSQIEQFNQNKIDERMMHLWARHGATKQTLIFNINVEHNNRVVEMFKSQGIDAAGVDAKTVGRDKIDEDFQKGKIQVLCNVSIHTKGSDFPEIGCVIANHATMSMAKYFQEVGRGSRPYKGKNNFIFIDMGNNLLRFGSYNDDVDWLSIFNDESKDKKTTVKKTKLCNICYAYLHNPFVLNCPVCNTQLITKNLLSMESQMPENLVNKNINDMTFQELLQYQKFRGFKNGWAWFQKFGQSNKRRFK